MKRAMISLLFVLAVTCSSPTDAAEESKIQVLVAEHLAVDDDDWGGKHEGIWPREIIRQQILLIAREEFGAFTRDGSLNEPTIGLDATEQFRVGIAAYATVNDELHLRLANADGESILESDYEFRSGVLTTYKSLIRLARREVSDDVRAELQKLGLKVHTHDSTEWQEPNDLKNDLSLLGQLEKLQSAHHGYRETGSTAALESIVVAYSNLGVLTLDYWNGTSDVFAVRSLLYADLLVETSGGTARSLAYRAYAKSLAGLHRWAAEDALQVEKAQQQGGVQPGLPIWTNLLLPYCRFRPSKIEEISQNNPSLQPLAQLMLFRIAVSGNDRYLIRTAARKLIRTSPLSFQTLSWLSPGPTHALLRRSALEYFSRATIGRLSQTPNLPDAVAGTLKTIMNRRDEQMGGTAIASASKLSQQLIQADPQPIEPSPNLMGQLVYEDLFVHVVEQLKEFSDGTKTDLSVAAETVRTFVKDHPYDRYITFLGIDQEKTRQEASRIFDGFDFTDPRPNMSLACRMLFYIQTPQHDKFGYHVWQSIEPDYTEPRMSQQLRGAQLLNYDENTLISMGKRLGRVSPYAPATVRMQISRIDVVDDDKLERFRMLTREDPTGMEFLAALLQKSEKPDEAIEMLDRALQLSPSVNRYTALANTYYADGQYELWKATLEDSLQEENEGLSHATVHNQLALGLLQQGKLDAAKPHALTAAATWSGWGMQTASRVLEGLQEWDDSELWMKRTSENYAGVIRAEWYLWCKRNGRGDLDGAIEQFDTFLRSPYSKNQNNLYLKAVREILEDRPRAALKILQQTQAFDESAWSSQIAALVAAKLEDQRSLASALADLKRRHAKLDLDRVSIDAWVMAEIVRTLSSPQGVLKPDYARANELISAVDKGFSTDACYIIGSLAQLAGDAEKAREYLQQALAPQALHRYTATLAGYQLHQETIGAQSRCSFSISANVNSIDLCNSRAQIEPIGSSSVTANQDPARHEQGQQKRTRFWYCLICRLRPYLIAAFLKGAHEIPRIELRIAIPITRAPCRIAGDLVFIFAC